MIQIVDDFLSEEECDNLISHFNNYGSFQEWDECKYVEITNEDKFKYILHRLNVHTNFKVDWTHVVKWDDDSKQNLHFDTSSEKTIYSSITYLNDTYVGGQTYFAEGTIIRPIKKRTLFFNGMKYKHGVMPVKKGPRYTLATWYKKA